MYWIKLRIEVINEALGPKRYMLLPLLGAIVGVADWLLAKFEVIAPSLALGIPSWSVGVFAALALFAGWMLEFGVQLKRRIRGTRTELSELRTEGVAIRNEGRRHEFLLRSEFDDWNARVEGWEKRVVAKIKELSEADAIWFDTLDVVPPPRLSPPMQRSEWAEDFFKAYREHDFRLARLGEMIRDLWRPD